MNYIDTTGTEHDSGGVEVAHPAAVAQEVSRAGTGVSLQQMLQDRREKLNTTKETLVPTMLYEKPKISIRYRLVDRREVEAVSEGAQRGAPDQGELMVRLLIDTMVEACLGVYYQMPGMDQFDRLLDMNGAQVMTFQEFAAYLGHDGVGLSPRESVMYCFGGNEFSVGQHAILLNRWFNNTAIKLDQDMLGELAP